MSFCPNLFQPLAVVCPVIPTLFSVLGPLILIVGFTFIAAIPRWLLMFAHCLWVRSIPRALRNRSIPGVHCHAFEGVAVKQFVDKYTFSMPGRDDLNGHIKRFFEQRGAKVEQNGKTLTFLRGNRFCTYFLAHIVPWREKDFLQKITVNMTRTLKGRIDIQIRYVVQTLCMLRLQPAGLQNEVHALYQELADS